MDDPELVTLLRAGNVAAFRELVAEYHVRLTRLAHSFSRNESVIEEAVQETWLAVVRGIDGFEGRAPLRAWIFSILANQARKLAVREKRHAEAAQTDARPTTPPMDAPEADDREPGMGKSGMWENPPVPWGLEDPESAMLRQETLQVIEGALEELPENQRRVVLLRDVEGLGSEEVCNILDISGTNERVLLHRGRARIRRALDAYMKGDPATPAPGRRQGTGIA